MTDELRIRAAQSEDISALHALVESAYRGDSARRGWTHEADLLDGQRTDREALTALLASPDELVLLALMQDALIGCVQVSRMDDGCAYLGMLAVDPARQGQGLGKHLIAAAEQAATAHFHAHMIEMTVIVQRAELIDYYVRRGYRQTGEQRPFPLDNPRFGLPRTRELAFTVLAKPLG